MLKPKWETLNLNISVPRQKLKNLVDKILGKVLHYPMHYFFLVSKLREEMCVSDIQTSIVGSEPAV